MKLFHLGDLHLGKRVNGFSMIDDQIYILEQILQLAMEERPDGVLIAGDIYDRSVPTGGAMGLLDGFLTELSKLSIFVCLIAGNHDSAERLGFAGRLLQKNNIFISEVFDGKPQTVTIEDEYGSVNIYLQPFIKPQSLWPYEAKTKVESYEDAIGLCIKKCAVDTTKRNVLIAHQFVTWGGKALRSDSETQTVGGVGEVDAKMFEDFDYVALGHLHQAQKMRTDFIRYAGSPLKYSFSEVNQKKSVTIIDLLEKGNTAISQIPLKPLRDMRQIKGPLEGLLAAAQESDGKEDYIRAILTNEEPLIDPLGQLRSVYPNMMLLDFDNVRSRSKTGEEGLKSQGEDIPPEKLFALFYEKQNGLPLNEKQSNYLKRLWQEGE